MSSLLAVNQLSVTIETGKDARQTLVHPLSLMINKGQVIGIVGESGSGKSQTAMSILKLFESNQKIVEGSIVFDGKDITHYTDKALESIRGNEISMIFQEPMSSLNPVFTVKKQIAEVLMIHQKMDKKTAESKTLEMLKAVKIPNPERVMKSYPHQLSGGMSQRVMIAMALACNPKLLIADEATTALDVIVQAEILKLMNELKENLNTSILFITHDLGVVSQMADDVIVMYKGKIVESAPVKTLFKDAKHPYTKRLLAAFLKTDIQSKKGTVKAINLFEAENEVYDFRMFKTEEAVDGDFFEVTKGHFVACTLK